MHSVVSIVKTNKSLGSPSEQSLEDVKIIKEMLYEATNLVGKIEKIVGRAKTVFVKPNVFHPLNPDNATVTDPRVIEALVSLLKEIGIERVLVGEDPAVCLSKRAFEVSGVAKAVNRAGGELVYLDEEPRVEIEVPEAKVLRRVSLPKIVLNSDIFISVPKIKTHLMTGLTLAIKNGLGVLVDEEKKRVHTESLHYKLVDILRVVKPDLVVEDGILVGEGQGPVAPIPVSLNLLIASTDVVAADAVASAVVGFHPYEISTTRIAEVENLGTGDLDKIAVKGKKIEEVKYYLKRPVTSPLGVWSNVEVFAGGACIPCLAILRQALDRLEKEGRIGELGKITCLIGVDPPIPEKLQGKVFILGDCAQKYKRLGTFIPGCPPIPHSIVIRKFGLSLPIGDTEYFKQKFFKEKEKR